MPLAATSSLFLLLGSLSLLHLSLVSRERLAVEQRLRLSEDQLVSAAHELVSRLALQHPCLLPLSRSQWSTAACAGSSDLSQLGGGSDGSGQWQILRWEPSSRTPLTGERAVMEFELHWIPQNGPARAAQFALGLSGDPLKVSQLRLLGWSGRA